MNNNSMLKLQMKDSKLKLKSVEFDLLSSSICQTITIMKNKVDDIDQLTIMTKNRKNENGQKD